MDVAIIGGTGRHGYGLALRLGKAGHHVTVGSRSLERAVETSERARERVGDFAQIDGDTNDRAAAAAGVVFVTVPHLAQAEVYKTIGPHLHPGVVVVDTTNPIAVHVKARPGEIQTPQELSSAEEAAALLPKGARLVAGFQTVAAYRLQDLDRPLEGDVLLCGDDDQAKQVVGSLVEQMPGLRWVDAGGLSMARAVERLTGLLISVNKRYGIGGATVHLHGHPSFGSPPA